MSAPAEPSSWWVVPIPGLVTLILMCLIFRKRRWRDLIVLRRATRIPPERIEPQPRAVRDMRTDESGWVSYYNIVTSKRGRIFVSWTALLEDAPADPQSKFAALQILRRKRGFCLDLRKDFEFRTTSLVLWGEYAPVIEITQAVALAAENKKATTPPDKEPQ